MEHIKYDRSRKIVLTSIDLPSSFDIPSESGIEMYVTCPAVCIPILFDGDVSELTYIIDEEGDYCAFSGDVEKHVIIVVGEEGDQREIELSDGMMLDIWHTLEKVEDVPVRELLDLCKKIIDFRDDGFNMELVWDY